MMELHIVSPDLLASDLNDVGFSSENSERFEFDRINNEFVRYVKRRDGRVAESRVKRPPKTKPGTDLSAEYDLAWLRSAAWPETSGENRGDTLRVADLFSGCGGLSLGLGEACRALQIRPDFAFACDINEVALDVYKENFKPEFSSSLPIEAFVDGKVGATATKAERAFMKEVGKIDFVVAGPPCQGHSDLNNHTRRNDPKNQLIIRVVRFVELFKPDHVLIENVQGIRHDRQGALSKARVALAKMGYSLSESVLRADEVGVAQGRKRFFLLASRSKAQALESLSTTVTAAPRSLGWAIGDLLDAEDDSIFNSPATHSAVNQGRINYLFDHDVHELPNSERPPCHRDKPHSYAAVYGRMYWGIPAPTVTTGFGSTGQGRFVHPLRRRTMTPHEAARVQFFPDFFRFGDRGRRHYQEIIGNAVPSKLAYSIALHQLR